MYDILYIEDVYTHIHMPRNFGTNTKRYDGTRKPREKEIALFAFTIF